LHGVQETHVDSMTNSASRLLSPGTIGPLTLKNRVIMAPMTTRKADAEGFVTESAVAYYKARADGGVGLITVEMASPEKVGKHRNFELGIYDDRFLPGLRGLVDVIHRAGAKASIQLGHGGGHTRADIAGEPPIAPSAIPHSVQEGHTEVIVPLEMTTARIAQTRSAFVAAACRAASAGFDAVEIHAAHGYLISQFLAPAENQRRDDYGGSLRNRARLAMEITAAVKAAVPRLAVTFRMNGDDFFEGGLTPDEAIEIAVWAADAGADALHMTGGHYRSRPTAAIMIPPMATPSTPFLRFAEAVRRRVRVPVIAVGRFGDPQSAIAAVEDERADFIALGRPLLADPNWVDKVARGHQVRLCLACNTCVDGMRAGRQLHCLVNARTGRELEYARRRLRHNARRIAVIGAGPAGLTYAALAAETNKVVVFEKDREVGGAFRLAGLAPRFQGVEANSRSLLAYVQGLRGECEEKGVVVRTSCDVWADPSLLEGFDHVVIATGARYRFGLGGLVKVMLTSGMIRWRPWIHVASADKWRDWFYYRLRRPGSVDPRQIATPRRTVEVLGDACAPGKSEQAIMSAYGAAFAPSDEAVKRPAASIGSGVSSSERAS
jgi:2,4-dienoyl-CoA reductase-like NADH-dependent reductase (Old Yellow Enzyme family)